MFKNLFFSTSEGSVGKVDTGAAYHDGTLMMMSLGASSLLSTVAFRTTEWQRKQCNLSKGKQLQSIGFSLQLCFHTAVEAGCRALMNDTLMFPSPLPPVSVLDSRVLSLQWCRSAGMSVCTGTWFSSMPRPQSTAVSFVIVDFKQCHGFAVEWGYDLSESCTLLNWIIPCSVVQLWEVELSCLPVICNCSVHSPGRNLIASLRLKYSYSTSPL